MGRTIKIIPTILILFCFTSLYYYFSHLTSVGTEYSYPPNRNNNQEESKPESIPLKHPVLSPSDSIPIPEALYSKLIPRLSWLSSQEILNYHDSLLLESQCSQTWKQSNQDQLNGNAENWKNLESSVAKEERKKVIDSTISALGFEFEGKGGGTSLSKEEWKDLFGNGERGIVFTAGNKDTSRRLLTSLKILRLHGCTLPVEIWGFENEISSLGEMKSEIEAQGSVTFRKLTKSTVQPGAWKQFQVKGEAITRCSFSEVLYLDSDNMVLRDPTFLFDAPMYKENGMVLWPDITKDSATNPIWRILDHRCTPSEFQAESGQLLVSKVARGGLNLAALLIAEKMNQEHEFWYLMSGGDKDTFRYACHLLSIPYSPAPHWLSMVGSVITPSFEGHTFCGHTMLQFGLSKDEWKDIKGVKEDFTPNHAPPLFVHANLLKHSGYNNQRGNTFQHIKSASPDLLAPTVSQLLEQDVRAKVYNWQGGMCTDMWDSRGIVNPEGKDGMEEGEWDKGRVEITSWTESWGGILKDFEEVSTGYE